MKAIVDCNSFYAACERVFEPRLHGRPVVVLSNNDGCIIARSDEAKALGVEMAGPYFQAREIIARHNVTVFSSNYHLYGDMSMRVMNTLRGLAPHVEVYSVDEAFLDLCGMTHTNLHAYAKLLRETVEQWTGIPVSVGIAPTKTLSKVANRLAKKDKKGTGCILVIQSEEEIAQALKATAIEDVWGVGRRYADKLRSFGVNTAWDLRNLPEGWARQHMGGVVGVRLIKELNGEPCIHMKPALETKKMIATTRMFGRDVTELKELREAVATYTARAAEKLRRQLGAASFLQVFVVVNEYTPGRQYNPRTYGLHCILPEATSITPELIRYALPLVDQLYRPGYKYKKAGVLLAGIVPDATVQASLFQEHVKPEDRKLMAQIDNINFSMRDGMVQYASQGLARNWKMRQEKRSPRYSSRWEEMRVIR